VSAKPWPSDADPVHVVRAVYAFRRNLVLAASAGTGKTHALVGVALHLLVGACRAAGGGLREPIAPDTLVATTFSRKAAGEIRSRLAAELERLASDDPRAAYRADILAACTEAGVPPFTDAVLRDRAAVALSGLGRAKIGTLHSFAASIVRDHALVVGLSPDFDLLDEESTEERATLAILDVLETRANDEHVMSLIELAGGVTRTAALVRRLLEQLADDGRPASSLALADDDAARVDRELSLIVDHARDLRDDPRLGEASEETLAAYAHGDVDGLLAALEALFTVTKSKKRSAAADAFFEHRDRLPGTTNSARARALIHRWSVRHQMLPRAAALKSLLVGCAAEIARANLRDSVLGFADVLLAARDLLRDHPALAGAIGASFDALLVDEFQDTSSVQRDLVYLLWERRGRDGQVRLAGMIPSAAELRDDGLLVVGDRKQSIYAFRGADAAVFAEVAVSLAGAPARLALAIPRGRVAEPERPVADFASLRHNRRGEPELLTFANAFSRLALVPEAAPAELYEVDYAPETEDLLSPGPPREAPAEARTHWLRVSVPAGRRASDRRDEARVMAARISCIVRGGELTVRDAPARFRDVAILGPTHEVLAVAAHELAALGIPHVVAGMGFHAAAEVRDVVAMLACLVDPDDTLARVEVLRGPWAGVSDRTLLALSDGRAGLSDAARWGSGDRTSLIPHAELAAVRALAAVLTELRPVIGRIGPGAALREAVRALALEETLMLLPRGAQRVANVRKVLALADAATDPLFFLQRLRAAAAEEQREGEAATFSDEDDAVRLLTVHASKGLAFPIVFLPAAGAVQKPTSLEPAIIQTGVAGRPSALVLRVVDDLGSHHDSPSYATAKSELLRREVAERRRQRYVAITRAASAMFFVGDCAASESPSGTNPSTAAVLGRLAESAESRQAAQLVVESGASLARRVDREASLPATEGPPQPSPRASPPRRIEVRAEALRDAARCVRRHQLAHEHGLARRPRFSPVPREELCSAGDWGARLARDEPLIVRGEEVALAVPGDGGLSVVALGTVDVTVSWPDGTVDALCYADSEHDAAVDDLHASILGHAVAAKYPAASSVRVGSLTADGRRSLRWVDVRDRGWTDGAVRAAAERIVSSSRAPLAPRIEGDVCRRTRCPFLAVCHGEPDDVG